MKIIEVDTDILNKSRTELLSDIDGIKTVIDSTYDGITALDAMWDGPANEAFCEQFRIDYERMSEILSDLRNYAERMDEARRRYIDGENKVANVIASIKL